MQKFEFDDIFFVTREKRNLPQEVFEYMWQTYSFQQLMEWLREFNQAFFYELVKIHTDEVFWIDFIAELYVFRSLFKTELTQCDDCRKLWEEVVSNAYECLRMAGYNESFNNLFNWSVFGEDDVISHNFKIKQQYDKRITSLLETKTIIKS